MTSPNTHTHTALGKGQETYYLRHLRKIVTNHLSSKLTKHRLQWLHTWGNTESPWKSVNTKKWKAAAKKIQQTLSKGSLISRAATLYYRKCTVCGKSYEVYEEQHIYICRKNKINKNYPWGGTDVGLARQRR